MKVKYIGASELQAKVGRCNDPRKILKVGDTYEVIENDIHSWHTEYTLKGYDGYRFNSVCFEEIK